MNFTPKFQSVSRMMGLEAKQETPTIPLFGFNSNLKNQPESEHSSPRAKSKLNLDLSPINGKKDQMDFTLSPRNVFQSRPSLDSFDQFSTNATIEPSPRGAKQLGSFSEVSVRKMIQNTGNAIAYGFNENISQAQQQKIPKLDLTPTQNTPRNQNNTNKEFSDLISQVKEGLYSERNLGRSHSTNIDNNYGNARSINDFEGNKKSSKKDLSNIMQEPENTSLNSIDSPTTKKKKAVKFKEKIEERQVDFNEYHNAIFPNSSKMRTKYDKHEYLGINVPISNSHTANSSSLLLMKLFKKNIK